MDRQDYLDQISAMNRPVKGGQGNSILSSKFFKIGLIGVVGLVLILIIGALLGGGKDSEENKINSLILHIENTSEVIEEYQQNVKSSDLRSYSSSLYSVLSNTSLNLTENVSFDMKKVSEKIVNEANEAKDGLANELFNAKINGILDRTYAHKMAYEISIIANDESQILKSTKKEDLKQILNTSYNSLVTLYDKFNDFSAR